jgi:hypothetical protein
LNAHEKQKLAVSDGIAFDQFGSSVSIAGDYAIVGDGAFSDQGAAYVFIRSGSLSGN